MPRRGRPRKFDRASAVTAAMELFWKNGYASTTLGDLCEVIGITPPSFYCAFKTREDLFLETIERYMELYWNKALADFMAEEDIYKAAEDFLIAAVKIYSRPNLPRGCFIDVSAGGLSAKDTRVIEALNAQKNDARELFRKKLLAAINSGQLPPDCDVRAITGALYVFLKGLATAAREDLCQAELTEIVSRGLSLLPAPQNKNK